MGIMEILQTVLVEEVELIQMEVHMVWGELEMELEVMEVEVIYLEQVTEEVVEEPVLMEVIVRVVLGLVGMEYIHQY